MQAATAKIRMQDKYVVSGPQYDPVVLILHVAQPHTALAGRPDAALHLNFDHTAYFVQVHARIVKQYRRMIASPLDAATPCR